MSEKPKSPNLAGSPSEWGELRHDPWPKRLTKAFKENLPKDADGKILPHSSRQIRAGLDLLFSDPKFAKACRKILYERGGMAFETSFDWNVKGFADAVLAEYRKSKK